jgi:hypothetical protein
MKKLTSKSDFKSVQDEIDTIVKNDKKMGMLLLVDSVYGLEKMGYEVAGDLRTDLLKRVNRADPKHQLTLNQIEAGQMTGWIKNISVKPKQKEKGGK